MAALYFHIPYCRKRCTYCNFHFSTSLKSTGALVAGLCAEMKYWATHWPHPFTTIYFGGGTPSLLSIEQLQTIMKTAKDSFQIESTETTLEANPEDMSELAMNGWLEAGVNRLSVGIQSFSDDDLRWMNRGHTGDEAANALERAHRAGFRSLSADLIFGIPNQSENVLNSNIATMLSLPVNHISAYALTAEPRTAYAKALSSNTVSEVPEMRAEADYLSIHHSLSSGGFEHYEVSNYARAGHRAVHNSSYWAGSPYLGIGPSAHSFDGNKKRWWNVANNAQYALKVQKNESWFEGEILTPENRANEQLMTGLRRAEGLRYADVEPRERAMLKMRVTELNPGLTTMCEADEFGLRIMPKHWLLSDEIIKHLML